MTSFRIYGLQGGDPGEKLRGDLPFLESDALLGPNENGDGERTARENERGGESKTSSASSCAEILCTEDFHRRTTQYFSQLA